MVCGSLCCLFVSLLPGFTMHKHSVGIEVTQHVDKMFGSLLGKVCQPFISKDIKEEQ